MAHVVRMNENHLTKNHAKEILKKATFKLNSGPFKDLSGKQFQPIG